MITDVNRVPRVSVIVPVYNAEHSLVELVDRIQTVMTGEGLGYEVLLINDASRDASWTVIQELARSNGCIRGVNFSRNFGQHNALLCGIRLARGAVIVTLDDDLQNPPEAIPVLLAELKPGIDVVYGTPLAMKFGVRRSLASIITKVVLARAMGADTARKISAFRAFKTEVRRAFRQYNAPLVNIDVLLTWGTTRFTSVDVRQDSRKFGTSNYTFARLVTHTINMATGFSTMPLRVASVVGFACALFGVCLLAYVLGRYVIMGTTVPGFPFLASVIAIFSGAQMFSMGVMGEYLARMYFRSMDQPVYLVSDDTLTVEQGLQDDRTSS